MQLPQVVLPTQTDAALPDWFFNRTSADVKRDYLNARKQKEQSQVLMTRAMREQLVSKARKSHVFTTIRVRFPEGYMLQGPPFLQPLSSASVFKIK